MEKVDFTLKDGRVRKIGKAIAVVLAKRGRGTYQTRDMATQPHVAPTMAAQTLTVEDDGLDELDKVALHALAKERGVFVHHMAGADKVRAALRETE